MIKRLSDASSHRFIFLFASFTSYIIVLLEEIDWLAAFQLLRLSSGEFFQRHVSRCFDSTLAQAFNMHLRLGSCVCLSHQN